MHTKSASELHRDFLNGIVSAKEIVLYFLDRIQTHNPTLNAFLLVHEERALKQAEILDAKKAKGDPLGKLAGIPIAIKDNLLVKGELCTCASKMLENFVAPYDATVIELLESEDAILIGRTNMDEFAMGGSGTHSAFGSTKNPWDLSATPGGSSSGSAASVSACLSPLSLGTDTGGSIRQPAAFTGIVGYKPTYGRVSRYGAIAFGSSLDHIGPFARNVEDIALAMEVMGKHCDLDSTSLRSPSIRYTEEIQKPITKTRVGIPWDFLENLCGEAGENFKNSIDVLKNLGMEIVDVDLSILKYGISIYYILATAEASTNLARFDGIRYGYQSPDAKTLDEIYKLSRSQGFGWEVKNRILLGTSVLSSDSYEECYAKAQKVRTLIISKMREAFRKCDMIAMPTAPSTAFPLEGMDDPLKEYLQDLYTVGANLAGLPAISLPSGMSKSGKPFAIQFMGPQTEDARVLRFAKAFETAFNFEGFPPAFGGLNE